MLTAARSVVQKKLFESGVRTLVIWNEEMDDFMKMVKSPEDLSILLKDVFEKCLKEPKE